MQQRLSLVALLVSLIALALSAVTYCQADARAEAAVQRQERKLAERSAPYIRKICDDFKIKGPPADPQTLDEVMEPLFRLFEGLSK